MVVIQRLFFVATSLFVVVFLTTGSTRFAQEAIVAANNITEQLTVGAGNSQKQQQTVHDNNTLTDGSTHFDDGDLLIRDGQVVTNRNLLCYRRLLPNGTVVACCQNGTGHSGPDIDGTCPDLKPVSKPVQKPVRKPLVRKPIRKPVRKPIRKPVRKPIRKPVRV